MARKLSARFQIYNKTNIDTNTWDVLVNIPVSNGDINDIVVNSVIVFDLGSQNYVRFKITSLDTQGPPSGTQRWVRAVFDDEGTPPTDIGWNDGIIMGPFDSSIPIGWVTYAAEQALSQSLVNYADNMNEWAEKNKGAEYVKADATAFTQILSTTDTTVQKALETLDTHTHAFSTDATGIATVTTNFNNILSASDTDVQKALDTLDDHSHETTLTMQVMREPTGFPNLTDSQYSFDSTSRTFTIQPVSGSFDIWYYGNKITKTSPDSIVISDQDGVHFIYFDSNGNLQDSLTRWDLSLHVPVVAIYWNVSRQEAFVLEERHGLSMDWATHKYLHTTIGTRYVSGLDLFGYVVGSPVDNDLQFGLTSGKIADEDLEHNIVDSISPTNPFEQILSKPAQIPIMSLEGSGVWYETPPTDFVARTAGTGRLAYNSFDGTNWIQVEATNNYYVAYWIVATNDINNPIKAVQGQREDSSLTDAIDNNTWDSLNLGTFPFTEAKILYRIIYKTSTVATNTIKARIDDVADFRNASLLPTSTYVATDHGTLSGLNDPDHPASAIYTQTTNFNNILSSSDVDVQSALETLDDHTHDSSSTTVVTTNFDGILSSADTNVQFALETIDNHTHPAPAANVISTNVTNFNNILSGTDTNVQTALETLDDHTHIIDSTSINTITTNFNNILSVSDTNIQKALDTLDDHTHPAPNASGVATSTTNFNGILSSADTDIQKALDTLDDHTHAAPNASAISTDTTTFNGILSAADTNIQNALNTIDDHSHTAAQTSTNTASFSGILSTSDVDVQTALETLSSHGHNAGEISLNSASFKGIVRSSNVQAGITDIDTYLADSLDIIVDAAIDGTDAVKVAIQNGHRKIGLKNGNYVWIDTLFDFSDGDSLEIVGLGENVNITVNTPTSSTFTSSTATGVFSGTIVATGTAIDISLNRIYTAADYTTNIAVGDILHLGSEYDNAYLFGKYTVKSVTSTYVEINEKFPFTENIQDMGIQYFWTAKSANALTFILKNLNITFNDTTNEFLGFSNYPYFNKIRFENVIFNNIGNFDYDAWPVDEYIVKNCKFHSTSNASIYGNFVAEDCEFNNVRVQYFAGAKNSIFDKNTETALILTNFLGYSASYMIDCNFQNATAYILDWRELGLKGFVAKGNYGTFMNTVDSKVYSISGYYGQEENPIIRTVTGSETLRIDDQIVLLNFSASGTITLPSIDLYGFRKLVIKDISGTIFQNPVTIDPSGNETIDGQLTFTFDVDYGALTLIGIGGKWHII